MNCKICKSPVKIRRNFVFLSCMCNDEIRCVPLIHIHLHTDVIELSKSNDVRNLDHIYVRNVVEPNYEQTIS